MKADTEQSQQENSFAINEEASGVKAIEKISGIKNTFKIEKSSLKPALQKKIIEET